MSAMVSKIISLTIVSSTVYSSLFKFYQRKHQSSASLAFVRGIHRWPVNSLHKGPVTWKMFPFDDVIMNYKKSINRGDSIIIFASICLCLFLFISCVNSGDIQSWEYRDHRGCCANILRWGMGFYMWWRVGREVCFCFCCSQPMLISYEIIFMISLPKCIKIAPL